MKVLVCGGRNYRDYDHLKTVLSALQVERGAFTTIIHGAQTGADTLADQYARRHNIEPLPLKAKWARLGKAAGPVRNKRMLTVGRPDLVVAFPGGKGTDNMVKQAMAAGIEVIRA